MEQNRQKYNSFEIPDSERNRMRKASPNLEVPLPMMQIYIEDIVKQLPLVDQVFVMAFDGSGGSYIYVDTSDKRLAVAKTGCVLEEASHYTGKPKGNYVGMMSIVNTIDERNDGTFLIVDLRYMVNRLCVYDYSERPADEEEAEYFDDCVADMIKVDGFITRSDVDRTDNVDRAGYDLYGPDYLYPAMRYLAYQMDLFYKKISSSKSPNIESEPDDIDGDDGDIDDGGDDDDSGDSNDGGKGRKHVFS